MEKLKKALEHYGFECLKSTDGFSIEYYYSKHVGDSDQVIWVYGENHREVGERLQLAIKSTHALYYVPCR